MHGEQLLEVAFYLCAWNEPCSCSISWRILVVELILYVGLNVETCSCWIACRNNAGLYVETLYSKIRVSLLGSSLCSSLEILSCRICTFRMLGLHGFDHMFSLLKRCKYSLYSDTMLHYGSTNPMLNVGCVVLVLNETNTDVHMYT